MILLGPESKWSKWLLSSFQIIIKRCLIIIKNELEENTILMQNFPLVFLKCYDGF